MSDVITGVRQVIQDLVAPDLKAHTVKLDALQKTVDERFASAEKRSDERFASVQKNLDERFASAEKHSDERFASVQKSLDERFASVHTIADLRHESVMQALDAVRAEIRSEFAALRASNQMEVLRQVTPISERMAVVESRTKTG